MIDEPKTAAEAGLLRREFLRHAHKAVHERNLSDQLEAIAQVRELLDVLPKCSELVAEQERELSGRFRPQYGHERICYTIGVDE